VSLGISIEPKYWDEKKSRIKPGKKNSARLNAFIQHKLAEMQDQVLHNETQSKSLTSRQLKEKVFGKPPVDFFCYASTIIEQYKTEGKYGTYDRTRSVMEKLKKYVEYKTLAFNDITPEFLKKYENYLRIDLKNKTNSIHSNLKFFRKLFNDAVRDETIEPSINPFPKFRLKLEKTKREYLSDEELEALINCRFDNPKLQLHRDMFVFAAAIGKISANFFSSPYVNRFRSAHFVCGASYSRLYQS
jgi:hypothetical protein